MKDSQRIALGGIVLLVVLRISIGWQFLYEGLWKIRTQGTSKPWTSAGYLKNARGPMRGVFRSLAGDPDELGWFRYKTVTARWNNWSRRFEEHYDLSDYQKGKLDRLINGAHETIEVGGEKRGVYAEPLEEVPAGFDDVGVSRNVIWYDADEKTLYIDARRHLVAGERAKLDALVEEDDKSETAAAWRAAVKRIDDRQRKGLGYKERLRGALLGNSELLGHEGWQRVGKLEQYKRMLGEYESDLSRAKQQFQFDHLDHTWKEIQALRAELTGPIKSLEAELKSKAQGMLSVRQQKLGALSDPWTPLRVADLATMTGLGLLGLMLILGLKTRWAAIAGAFMLFNFYMAMPPWPGVPEAPGPEHAFIINKNLIEVVALLALATMPTGYWFGLDGVIARWWASRGDSTEVDEGGESQTEMQTRLMSNRSKT